MGGRDRPEAGGPLSGREAAVELLSPVLVLKGVSRYGRELLSRACTWGNQPIFGWGGWEQEGCLASVLGGLADERGPVAGREWYLPGPPLQCLRSTCRVESARHQGVP